MPATSRNQHTADEKFRREAVLMAWKQCLQENGLTGAIGCAHLAVEAGNKLLTEVRNSVRDSK